MKVKELRPGDWITTCFKERDPDDPKMQTLRKIDGLLIAVEYITGRTPWAYVLAHGTLRKFQASYCLTRIPPQ